MVSGRTYEFVRASAVRAGVFLYSGTSIARMVAILELCTRRAWTACRPDEFGPLAEHAAVIRSRGPIVVLIRCPDVDNLHRIGGDGGFVFDPEEERRRPISRYPLRAWVLRRILSRAR